MQQIREIISIVESWLAKQTERPNQFACTSPNYIKDEGWQIGVALGKDHKGLVLIDCHVESRAEGEKIAKLLAREFAKRDWVEMRGVVDLRVN